MDNGLTPARILIDISKITVLIAFVIFINKYGILNSLTIFFVSILIVSGGAALSLWLYFINVNSSAKKELMNYLIYLLPTVLIGGYRIVNLKFLSDVANKIRDIKNGAQD